MSLNPFVEFIKAFQFPYKNRELISRYQLRKLQEIVHYAYKNVPFYRKKYHGIDLTMSSLEDIQKLPVVTSRELRKCRIEELTSEKANPEQLLEMASAGTSGSPLRVKISKKENTLRQLNLLRFMLGYGWVPWWKVVYLTREIPHEKYSFFQKLINKKKFDVDIHQPIEKQVRQIKKIKPQLLNGMPTGIEQIADWLIDHEEHLPGLRLLNTGGEVKKEHHVEKFNKAFGMPGLQRYGAWELGIMGYSCTHCHELCINEREFLAEVVDDSYISVKNGEQGKVLFTALNQYTTPLIRYETGDLITLSGSQDHCKTTYLHFKSIDGRDVDVLPLKDGRKLHAQNLLHAALNINGLKKIQLLLKKDGSLLVKYIVDNGISDETVHQEVIEVMHLEELDVNFERCSEIPNEPSGKYKFLKME